MATSARELYDQYLPHHQEYRGQASALETALTDCIEEAGIQKAVVTARAKDPLEFFKKQLRRRYDDPWIACPDIVAARIMVGTSSEKSGVLDSLHNSQVVRVIGIEDQKEEASPSEIRYRGLHAHVTSEAVRRPDGTPMQCEVQIRTTAEHAWAETEHRYIYKNGEVPDNVKRHFNRLLVLMELFDLQLEEGVRMARELDGFRMLELSQQLEVAIAQLTRVPSDSHLTLSAVREIESLGLGGPARLQALVEVYMRDHREEIDGVLAAFGPTSDAYDVSRDWITTQGEMLLLLALLDEDEYRLSNALVSSELFRPTESLALATGHRGFLRS